MSVFPNLPRPGTGHGLCSICVTEEEKPAVLTLQSPLMLRTAARNDHKAPREVESGSTFQVVQMKALNISCTQIFFPCCRQGSEQADSRSSGCTVSCQHVPSSTPKKKKIKKIWFGHLPQAFLTLLYSTGQPAGMQPCLCWCCSAGAAALTEFVFSCALISAQLQPRAGWKLQAGATLLQ